jgi:bifunctional DNA-binding transcriptional regulator/antitoxin component of YhaV-PrlF toxin-antitoxin module
MNDRRLFLSGLVASLAGIFAVGADVLARPRRRRRKLSRTTKARRARRRVRRRVSWRVVSGRRRLIVPVAVAVGWELQSGPDVLLVKEVHEHHVIVEKEDGTTEKVDIIKEDTPENLENIEGSLIEEDASEPDDGDE